MDVIARERYDAVLFDLDGVLTDTAQIHASSWERMFDAYLQGRARRTGEAFRPFDIATDYRQLVEVGVHETRYALREGDQIAFRHNDEVIELTRGDPVAARPNVK